MSTFAESSAGFVTGGRREPVPESERLLPAPKGVSLGSIYRDRTGRLWRLDRRPKGKKWWSPLIVVTEAEHQSRVERMHKLRRLAGWCGVASLIFMIGSLFLPVPPLDGTGLWSELVWPLAFRITLIAVPVIVTSVLGARADAANAWFEGTITLAELERISGKSGDELRGLIVDGRGNE